MTATISRIRVDASSRIRLPATPYEAHELIWKFFADRPDRQRDFIYRYDAGATGATFLAVSARPPQSIAGWNVESKPYEVEAQRGDRFKFSLRANPTRRDHSTGASSDRRHDVVIIQKRKRRLAGLEAGGPDIVQAACTAWLADRGAQNGFTIDAEAVIAEGYRQETFSRPRDSQALAISAVDFQGLLTVEDADRFTVALRQGVGPAKGFGFGLLLVKRI